LELGYLSNSEDERLMREEEWRLKVAAVVGAAVKNHAETHRSQTARP
jgi:N-acetylmuramoyl-L-alanine amidase